MAATALKSPDQQRRGMIAQLHLAQKHLHMDDADYRAVLDRMTGKNSAKHMSLAELERALGEFRRLGFSSKARPDATPRRRAASAPAAHPSARKARALWISLYHLGVVRDPREKALEAFARRQLKCDRMAWARQSDCFRLIEALKAMAERHGWAQRGIDGQALSVEQLQEGLCIAILARLKAGGAVVQSMALHTAIAVLGGYDVGRDMLGPAIWPRIAAAMGQQLRDAGLARGEEA